MTKLNDFVVSNASVRTVNGFLRPSVPCFGFIVITSFIWLSFEHDAVNKGSDPISKLTLNDKFIDSSSVYEPTDLLIRFTSFVSKFSVNFFVKLAVEIISIGLFVKQSESNGSVPCSILKLISQLFLS